MSQSPTKLPFPLSYTLFICYVLVQNGIGKLHFVVKDLEVQLKVNAVLADDGWISSLFIRFMELCPISSQPESVQTKTLYFPHLSLETDNKIFF